MYEGCGWRETGGRGGGVDGEVCLKCPVLGGVCLALVGGDSQGRLGSGEGGLITLVALHCTHPF